MSSTEPGPDQNWGGILAVGGCGDSFRPSNSLHLENLFRDRHKDSHFGLLHPGKDCRAKKN